VLKKVVRKSCDARWKPKLMGASHWTVICKCDPQAKNSSGRLSNNSTVHRSSPRWIDFWDHERCETFMKHRFCKPHVEPRNNTVKWLWWIVQAACCNCCAFNVHYVWSTAGGRW
jgi:hypothetical protein